MEVKLMRVQETRESVRCALREALVKCLGLGPGPVGAGAASVLPLELSRELAERRPQDAAAVALLPAQLKLLTAAFATAAPLPYTHYGFFESKRSQLQARETRDGLQMCSTKALSKFYSTWVKRRMKSSRERPIEHSFPSISTSPPIVRRRITVPGFSGLELFPENIVLDALQKFGKGRQRLSENLVDFLNQSQSKKPKPKPRFDAEIAGPWIQATPCGVSTPHRPTSRPSSNSSRTSSRTPLSPKPAGSG